jgi:choline-sulfatase
MESHAPYEPVEPFRSRFQRLDSATVDPDAAKAKLLRWVGTGTRKLSPAEIDHLESLYDGEAASVDAEIRLLVSELDALGFFANAVVVFTADHGEEFAEHGEVLHGRTLYNAAIKIPLIIVAPGFAGGHVVDENVSLLDVAPTVQDLAGALPQANAEGHSLRRLMKPASGPVGAAPSAAPSPVLCELEPESKHHTRAHTDAIIERSYKLLLRPDGETELFDLSRDPGEQHPLSPAACQPSAAELLGALETRQAELRLRANVSRETQPVDEATREKLRALGYQF